MDMFKVEDIFLSNAILDQDKLTVSKYLNLSVRVQLEEIQDLRSYQGTSHEDLAVLLGDAVKRAFLKCKQSVLGLDDTNKLKLSFHGPHLKTEEADKKEFGWYKLNENKETSNG